MVAYRIMYQNQNSQQSSPWLESTDSVSSMKHNQPLETQSYKFVVNRSYYPSRPNQSSRSGLTSLTGERGRSSDGILRQYLHQNPRYFFGMGHDQPLETPSNGFVVNRTYYPSRPNQSSRSGLASLTEGGGRSSDVVFHQYSNQNSNYNVATVHEHVFEKYPT